MVFVSGLFVVIKRMYGVGICRVISIIFHLRFLAFPEAYYGNNPTLPYIALHPFNDNNRPNVFSLKTSITRNLSSIIFSLQYLV